MSEGNSNERYHDFDADAKEISFTMKGKTYKIADDPPAKPILQAIADGSIQDQAKLEDTLAMVIGSEILEELHEKNVGIRALTRLSEWLMFELGFTEKDPFAPKGDDDADDKTPALMGADEGKA